MADADANRPAERGTSSRRAYPTPLTAAASPSSAALLTATTIAAGSYDVHGGGGNGSYDDPEAAKLRRNSASLPRAGDGQDSPAVLLLSDSFEKAVDGGVESLHRQDHSTGTRNDDPTELLGKHKKGGGDDGDGDGDSDHDGGSPRSPTIAAEAENAAETGKRGGWLWPYYRLLRDNREYRVLFFGNIISGLGDWFNIIASLSVLNAADGSALALAFYTAINSLPALLLGPVIGVVTDRYNKKTLMIVSLIVRALTAVGLVFCQTPETLPGMYVLTFVKYTFTSVYQPSRTAVVPAVVSKTQLVLANGLDGIVWSCMLFVGGAAGGFATSLFGITTAYILDGIAYLIAAYVLGFLLSRGGPWLPFVLLGTWFKDTIASQGRFLASITNSRQAAATTTRSQVAYNPMLNEEEEDDDEAGAFAVQMENVASNSNAHAARVDGSMSEDLGTPVTFSGLEGSNDEPDPSDRDLDGRPRDLAMLSADLTEDDLAAPAAVPLEKASADIVGAAAVANVRRQSSWRMVVEGFSYMWAVRYVFAICFFKGSLQLTIFAIGENGALSTGINYMVSGTGTILQPIITRRFVKSTARNTQLTLGAIALSFAYQYHWFIVANLFRSGSTSIGLVCAVCYLVHSACWLWQDCSSCGEGRDQQQIYSSLILQQVVPGPLRGRVFSFEQTITTVCNVASRAVAGVAIDYWEWSIFQVDALAAVLAGAALLAWALYFRFSRRQVARAYEGIALGT